MLSCIHVQEIIYDTCSPRGKIAGLLENEHAQF